jgi:hypothetical protein
MHGLDIHNFEARMQVGWCEAAFGGLMVWLPLLKRVPLEIHMHGLDIHNFEARMQVGVDCCCRVLCKTMVAAAIIAAAAASVWLG